MATLGEYGSLLQLGFGIGVGLSVFRAPLELIAKGLESDINAELGVVEMLHSEKARNLKIQLSDLKIDLSNKIDRLENLYVPYLIAAVITALVNWFLLWCASTSAGYPLSSNQEWALTFVAGPIYVVIGLVLWVWAQLLLLPLRGRLDALRKS
ncbi:hypothetical protein FDV58_24845 [Bradyrhizobium elkanii]|uniref:Uncharacterized protein n=1 Tax=Bradyrhizobium elkanii TaxID=29448 RepID=A0A4U6RYY6_BRAEL|nr:hypothetical protein [Bradyrhizobium elkanii]TKV78932.1 hypothetical protein FDV58_24845 [Bradyrhizobium elkanii]